MPDELRIEVAPPRGNDERLSALSRDILRLPEVRGAIKRGRARVLSVEALEDDSRKRARPKSASRYLATVFDYSENRTLLVRGSIDDGGAVEVEDRGLQPPPNDEEFEAAVEILHRDDELAASIRKHRLEPYRPMPPLVTEGQPNDLEHRVVAVGLAPTEGMRGHTIVGVDMVDERVIRFENNAPPTAAAHNPICGQPVASQPTASKGTPGQVWVNVYQGGTRIWRFLAVRPAASSGTNGSGIELRFVDYRGKRVLYRAHVPILNVKYDNNACGPYLDWQYQEGMINSSGTDVAPGFRLSGGPSTTILDTGSDVGNFLGVGIYVTGQEVVLVSEMQAGWYRYVSEWRLHANGTIRPRFGFGAVTSSCVCTRHHHHAYWRFDFDIRTAGGNRVREFNDPPLVGGSNWHTKTYEAHRPRDPSRKRRWRVENVETGHAYDVIPGADDGVASKSPDWPFPQGDVWITRYRGNEIDTGVTAVGPPYEANIAKFVTGERIDNADVVLWYAAHATHDVQHDEPGHFGHIVGPELRPAKW